RGRLWVAALGGGLLRIRSHGASALIERIEYESKTNGSPRALFQDREANIWVGMRGGGLLRVAPTVVDGDSELEGATNDGVRALSVGHDGSVFVATGHSLNRFTSHGRTVHELPQSLALYNDRSGRMWVSTAHGMGEVHDGRFTALSTAPQIRWE